MENLKKKIQMHNLYSDVYRRELVDVETRLVAAKMRKEFLEWSRDEQNPHEPDFKRKIKCPEDEFSIEAAALVEGLAEFVREIRVDGFYGDLVCNREEDGKNYYNLIVAFMSPQDVEKMKKDPAYKKMKSRMRDMRFGFGVLSDLDKVFKQHCCEEKMKAFEHKSYNLFRDIMRSLYDELIKKKKIPAPAKRAKDGGITVHDEKTKKTVEIMTDIILWKKYGSMTIIEAFSKGKEKTLKRHFKV